MFESGEFNLNKFVTNCANLTEKIKQEDPSLMKKEQSMSYAQATLGSSQKGIKGEHKILGVLWNPGKDEFIVALGRVALEARSVCPPRDLLLALWGSFMTL